MLFKPAYEYDCKCCAYLRSYEIDDHVYDVYKRDRGHFLIVYGSEDGEYISGSICLTLQAVFYGVHSEGFRSVEFKILVELLRSGHIGISMDWKELGD